MMGLDGVPRVDDCDAHPGEIFDVPGRNTCVQRLGDTGDLNIDSSLVASTDSFDREQNSSSFSRACVKRQNPVGNEPRQCMIEPSLQVSLFPTDGKSGNAVMNFEYCGRRQVKFSQLMPVYPGLYLGFAINIHQRREHIRIENDHLSKSTVRMRELRRIFFRCFSNSFLVSSSYGIFANSRANLVPAPSPVSSASGAGSFAALSKISRTSASRLTPRASARRLSRTLTSSDTFRTRIWAICYTSDIMISKRQGHRNFGRHFGAAA